MKYAKMLALVALAAGALMAFIGAGTASANKICSTTVSPCPAGQAWPEDIIGMDWSLTSGTSASLTQDPGETIDTCKESTVKGTFTQGTTASNTGAPTLHVEELKWGNCSFTTTTTHLGTLKITQISGTSNGTVTGSGFEVTINTVFFGSCVYGTGENKDLGKVTEGKPPVFDAEATVNKLSGSNFACPATALWNATYTLTTPSGTTGAITAS
jgi:hypothetical protein